MVSFSPRVALATWSVRLVNHLSRWTGRGSGTVAGGRVGLAIEPRLLARLSSGRTVIAVTGTNGKTTTSALVATGWGGPVAANATGANMPAGHVAALVSSNSSKVVLECDEAFVATVIASVDPTVLVLLNLSRDQMDRANEVRSLAQRWRVALAAHPNVLVVANANDPLVYFATEEHPRVHYVGSENVWHGDAQSCPRCTAAIHFDTTWWCECGFRQPPAIATVGSDGALTVGGVPVTLGLALPGYFNRVNAAFAVAALTAVGERVDDVASRLTSVSSVAGRYSTRRFGKRSVRMLLAKNPAGVAALVAELADATDEVWVALNANGADGRDPSWIYDAPFEKLAGRRVRCLGDRRLDLATRLEVDGVDAVVCDESSLERDGDPVTLIANYTAFQEWLERTSSL